MGSLPSLSEGRSSCMLTMTGRVMYSSLYFGVLNTMAYCRHIRNNKEFSHTTEMTILKFTVTNTDLSLCSEVIMQINYSVVQFLTYKGPEL